MLLEHIVIFVDKSYKISIQFHIDDINLFPGVKKLFKKRSSIPNKTVYNQCMINLDDIVYELYLYAATKYMYCYAVNTCSLKIANVNS